MAKKKSKTQKRKQAQRRKINKANRATSTIEKNVQVTTTIKKDTKQNKPKVVEKEKVNYNVAVTDPKKYPKPKKEIKIKKVKPEDLPKVKKEYKKNTKKKNSQKKETLKKQISKISAPKKTLPKKLEVKKEIPKIEPIIEEPSKIEKVPITEQKKEETKPKTSKKEIIKKGFTKIQNIVPKKKEKISKDSKEEIKDIKSETKPEDTNKKPIDKKEKLKEVNSKEEKRKIVDASKVIYELPLLKDIVKKYQARKINRPLKLKDNKVKLIKRKKPEIKKINLKDNKAKIKIQEPKPKIKGFWGVLKYINSKLHILFNAAIIVIFALLILGLIRIDEFKGSTILYIALIVGFLNIVAISYNKYWSGRIFTVLLCAGMIFGIYEMQYTYDFINNLNTAQYEYKTYYVVSFDNGLNKSIYNINNKKVGLLKDNCTNIERKLNTKLTGVKYIEYEDQNQMFTDFYNQQFRAVIVNENQYNYLKNNINNTKAVKILYDFKANAKKN